MNSLRAQPFLRRFPLLAMAMLCLVAGVVGGILRAQGALASNIVTLHGPLMVCGFLGTVIAVERAVALGSSWPYLAPVLLGFGGLLLTVSTSPTAPHLFVTAGSLVSALACLKGYRLSPGFALGLMALGSVWWAVGNGLWLWGWTIPAVTSWWVVFLVLTILAERLLLGRFFQRSSWIRTGWLRMVTILLLAAPITGFFSIEWSKRLLGAGLVMTGVWLLVFDIARHNLRLTRLPRFTGSALMSGYPWLLVGGLLFLWDPSSSSGPLYDSALHAVFLGFVFAMIMGHAPIVFPSILGRPIVFRRTFYLPLLLLHASLVVRLTGNLAGYSPARIGGAHANAAAIAVFFLVFLSSVLEARFRPPAS